MKNGYIIFISLLLLSLSACSPTPKTPEAIKYEESQKTISNGAKFPTYELPNKKGETISNTQFDKGDVFYLFWATWCNSCIDNIVAVREMKKKGLLKNVRFVSISVDKERDRWENFLYQYDMEDYMENVLLGKDREHLLSNFLLKELRSESDLKTVKYGYIAPAYCLVKDGFIQDNRPILPEDKDKFLTQFK